MLFQKQNSELDKFANLLQKAVVALFEERGVVFSAPPKIERRKIIDYEGRMRVDGMEKYNNEPTYVSVVNFFANEAAMQKKKTLGALVVYVQQEYLPKIMKLLQYPPVDDESDEAMLDSCGTLCNIIAGRFKSEISASGLIQLEMSAFTNFRNSSFYGVAFCDAEYDMIEMQCFLEGKKKLVVEMTMGAVPKK